MESASIEKVQAAVLAWYSDNGRHDLPWRNLESSKIDIPYGTMVSEFMLQQTQVDRVVPKYRAFLNYFPNVQKLAAASPSRVVTLWSGLGYNRRALFLHRSAQEIVRHYRGIVPNDPELLESLPGIGPYTAAAIAVFAYNHTCVVLDTNIERFYELLVYGYRKPDHRDMAALAAQFIPSSDSRIWHSALMDLMTEVRKAKTPLAQQQLLLQVLRLKPDWDLPELGILPLKRPKQTPFVRSERYYRGQIVAFLSHRKNHKATVKELRLLAERRALPAGYSLVGILRHLKRDGLVTYSEPLGEKSLVSLPVD